MISPTLALALQQAGLAWQPSERDCFAIPGDEFTGQIFTLNQLPTMIELLWGQPAVTFHGSSEWALDTVLTSEVVWLPTETQLRNAIERLLHIDTPIILQRLPHGYRCTIADWSIEAADAEEAYARALLWVLEQRATI